MSEFTPQEPIEEPRNPDFEAETADGGPEEEADFGFQPLTNTPNTHVFRLSEDFSPDSLSDRMGGVDYTSVLDSEGGVDMSGYDGPIGSIGPDFSAMFGQADLDGGTSWGTNPGEPAFPEPKIMDFGPDDKYGLRSLPDRGAKSPFTGFEGLYRLMHFDPSTPRDRGDDPDSSDDTAGRPDRPDQ